MLNDGRPALIGPEFVVDRQAAQPAPHGPLIARLDQDQRRREPTRPQPICKIRLLLLAHPQVAPRSGIFPPLLLWQPGLFGAYGRRRDACEPSPLFRRMLSGQQGVILDVDDELLRNAGAGEHRPRRVVGVTKPGGPHSARSKVVHHAALVRRQPVGRLAAAHAPDLADAGLPAQQWLAPRPRGHDIHRTAEARVQRANERSEQYHIAEGAAAHDERTLSKAHCSGRGTGTPGSGARTGFLLALEGV